MTKQLLVNALMTPDGTVIQSNHRHDYVTHIDATNGKGYMIDGGVDYIRCSNHGDERMMTYTIDSSLNDLRQWFTWGTYGIKGDQPFKRVKLRDMSNTHIINILETQFHVQGDMREMFENEIAYRHENDIIVEG